MRHHAFVIEAEQEKGIEIVEEWAKRELGMQSHANPDLIVLRYGLFSVEDARKVYDSAGQAPFIGDSKVLVIAASRAYHEAQNALLKLFEEPPVGTYLFLILPSLGGLLPTLRSRVQILDSGQSEKTVSEEAEKFITATREKRSAIIKKLTSGSDEDERREKREEAIGILNGIEVAAYRKIADGDKDIVPLLADIMTLRKHLYDRSAPVRMILEHLSLVTPKSLLQ